MKRRIAIAVLVALPLFVLFTAACTVVRFERWFSDGGCPLLELPCDFGLRVNEVRCLRSGVDPYDVWTGAFDNPPYYPYLDAGYDRKSYYRGVNAYTPWEYSFMYPISFLGDQTSWAVYALFMFACLGSVFLYAYSHGRAEGKDAVDCLIGAGLPIVAVAYPIWSNFGVGNYSVPILAAIVAMIWSVEKKRDFLAGLFLAFAMIKPQSAVLFVIPLLLRRRITVCAVAAMVCLVLSLPAVILSGKSLTALILEAPAASAHAFHGCGIVPFFIVERLGSTGSMVVAGLFGLVVCFYWTWILRQSEDSVLYYLPAAICSMVWTYNSSYSYVFGWFFVSALVSQWLKGTRGLLAISVITVILYSRFSSCVFGFSNAFRTSLGFTIPESIKWHVESLVSLAMLLTAVWFFYLHKSEFLVFERGTK